MADEIGGYFARLRLIVDQEDFNKGVRSLSMMELEIKQTSDKTAVAKNNWKDFVVGIAAALYIIKDAAAALKEMYGAMVDINKGTMKTSFQANTLGMSPNDLQKTFNALGLFGISKEAAGSVVQDLGLKVGAIQGGVLDQAQTLAFAKLGLDPSTLWGKKPTDIIDATVDAGVNMARKAGGRPQDVEYASSLINQILGGVGLTLTGGLLSKEANDRGLWNMRDVEKEGARVTFTSPKVLSEGVTGALATARLDTAVGSVKQEAAGVIGGALAPIQDELTNWLISHKEEIYTLIKGIAEAIIDIDRIMKIIWPKDAGQKAKTAAITDEAQLMKKYNFDSTGLTPSDKMRFITDQFNSDATGFNIAGMPGGWAKLFHDSINNPRHASVGTASLATSISRIPGDLGLAYSDEMKQNAITRLTNLLTQTSAYTSFIHPNRKGIEDLSTSEQEAALMRAGVPQDVTVHLYVNGNPDPTALIQAIKPYLENPASYKAGGSKAATIPGGQ